MPNTTHDPIAAGRDALERHAWQEAYEAGVAPPVVLEATHVGTTEWADLSALNQSGVTGRRCSIAALNADTAAATRCNNACMR